MRLEPQSAISHRDTLTSVMLSEVEVLFIRMEPLVSGAVGPPPSPPQPTARATARQNRQSVRKNCMSPPLSDCRPTAGSQIHVACLWVEVIPGPRGRVYNDGDQTPQDIEDDPAGTHGVVNPAGRLPIPFLPEDDGVFLLVGQLQNHWSLTDPRAVDEHFRS